MEYEDAKSIVGAMLRRRDDRCLKGTIVKHNLAGEIAGIFRSAAPQRPSMHHEREACLHVRKMVAEGEIEESMIDRRLYYKLPTQEIV